VAGVGGPLSMPKRRYEILLPAKFNDGRLVADACPRCVPDSLSEVIETFGAVTFRPEVAMGSWTFGGRRYDDTLSVLSVDVDDTVEHRSWIAHLKSHLLERFEQLELYVTSYPIEVH
jgi:hypothetical protein